MADPNVVALGKIVAKPAIQASIPIFKKLKDSVNHYYNDGFLDYFYTTLEKYQDIKTLLHRQPTNFYEIYYPAKLSYNKEIISTESVKDLFIRNNFVTIIGDAGSGKSTLIKHLFITSFLESYKAPIFIALRDLDIQKSDLEVYIRTNILQNKLAPSDDYLEKLLKEGEFLFFLDGYDEIKSTEKKEITNNIEIFIDKYPKNSFLLTSRPYSNIEYFKSFHNYRILDLDKENQVSFVSKQIKDIRLSEKIIDSIKEIKTEYIDSFLKNPLLLTLYIMTYSKNSSIPSNKYVFYRRVFDVLFAEHDSATKVGFEREIKTKLNQESLEEVLQIFSFLSYFENSFDFKKDYIFGKLNAIKDKKEDLNFSNNNFIEDMKLSIGLWVEDSGNYSFSHRSLQEYFAAEYVTNLSKESKKKVYKKIYKMATLDRNIEIKNFLDLCYEMDESFFIEYHLIPMLKNLKSFYIVNKKLIYDNAIPKFFMINNDDNVIGISVDSFVLNNTCNNIVRHELSSWLLANKVIKKLVADKDSKMFNTFFNCSGLDDDEIRFDLVEKINTKFIQYLEDIGLGEVLHEIILDIETMIKEYEDKLKVNRQNEDDFISMV